MMTKISTRTVSDRSYETDYEDFYEADHNITMAEANDLILADYRFRAGKPMILTMGWKHGIA